MTNILKFYFVSVLTIERSFRQLQTASNTSTSKMETNLINISVLNACRQLIHSKSNTCTREKNDYDYLE